MLNVKSTGVDGHEPWEEAAQRKGVNRIYGLEDGTEGGDGGLGLRGKFA